MTKTQKSRVATILATLAILALAAYAAYSMLYLSISTELAYRGAMEEVVNVDGYIIRHETIIPAPTGGTLVCAVSEEERVSVGMNIAAIISGAADESVLAQLKTTNERIAHYESTAGTNYRTDEDFRAEYHIGLRAENIIEAAYNQSNLSKIPAYKAEISDFMQPDPQAVLTELLSERERLLAKLPKERTTIYANASGVFSSQIDGYEEVFAANSREAFTPEYLQTATPTAVPTSIKEGTPCVKIANNYKWYIAAVVDEEWAEDLHEGQEITLRFPYINNESALGKVDSVVAGENGKATLIISCSKTIESTLELREVNVDIVKATYDGLRIPTAAIQENGGERGVYVVKDRQMRFKKIDILYQNELYTIVRRDDYSLDKDILLTYDEIVVRAKTVEEGRVVR